MRRRAIRGAALLPLDGRAGLRRTDLLLEDGRIAAIGGVSSAEVETVRGLVMPGLVQAHLHLELALTDRAFVPDQDPAVHLGAQRAAWVEGLDEPSARSSAQAGLAWSLAAGATTVADAAATRHRLAVLGAAQAVGARVLLPVDGRRADAKEALVVLEEAIAAHDLEGSVRVAVWGAEAERTSVGRLRAAARLAETRGLPLICHLGLRPGARGGVERLERAGALAQNLVLTHAHGQSLGSDRNLRRLADAGASVVVTPSFEVLTGAPPAPVVRLLEAGVAVGLGSECGATRLGLDVFAEARLASRLLEGRVERPALTALEMATRHGAEALGLPTGVIEVGRAADLLLVGIEPEEDDDAEAMARRVLDSAGPELLRQIWVGGEPRLGGRGARRTPSEDVLEAVRARAGAQLSGAAARTGLGALRQVLGGHLRRWRGWHGGAWPP